MPCTVLKIPRSPNPCLGQPVRAIEKITAKPEKILHLNHFEKWLT